MAGNQKKQIVCLQNMASTHSVIPCTVVFIGDKIPSKFLMIFETQDFFSVLSFSDSTIFVLIPCLAV